MSGLLLRELEVQAAGNEGDEQRVLGDALSLRCLGDRGSEILRESDEFVGGHGEEDSTCASGSVLVSPLSRKRAGGATNTPAPAKETELPMQAQASAQRTFTYEEIEARRHDPALRPVHFMATDRLLATVEEYEAKAHKFEGETRDQIEHIAELGRVELAKRGGESR